jgi:D-threo-aldose 1-dehydrogenase
MRSYEDSLQRLGLGRIDIVFFHDIDRVQHGADAEFHIGQALSGGLKALRELKQSGAIQGFGLGVNRAEIVAEFLEYCDLDVVLLAGRYSLLDQTADAEAFPLMASRGVQVVLGGIFNSGILAGGSTYDYGQADTAVLAKVHLIKQAAARHGITMPAAALQFALAHPIVEAVLNSASSPASVANTLAMAAMPIPEAYWQDMRVHGIISPTSPIPTPR